MKQEKIIIFDWGGVVESHTKGEYNNSEAAVDLLKNLNIKLSKEEIIKKINECCHNSHNKKTIEEAYNIYV